MNDNASTSKPSETGDVRLVTGSEMAHMSDAQAVSRIDALREAASKAEGLGDPQAARAYLSNACEIAQTNYVCLDVVSEYADFLDEHGLPQYAQAYREEHEQLTGMLARYGLARPDYEDRLRENGAKEATFARGATPDAMESAPREYLHDVADQARSASEGLATTGFPPRLMPDPARNA